MVMSATAILGILSSVYSLKGAGQDLASLVRGWTNDGKLQAAITDMDNADKLRAIVGEVIEDQAVPAVATPDQVNELRDLVLQAVAAKSGSTRIAGNIEARTGARGTAVGVRATSPVVFDPGTSVKSTGGFGSHVTGVHVGNEGKKS